MAHSRLSDEQLTILAELASQPRTLREIAVLFEVSYPTASRWVMPLKQLGLVGHSRGSKLRLTFSDYMMGAHE